MDLHRRFAGLYHLGHLKVEVFSFVETALTLMSVLYLRIVSVDSGGKIENKNYFKRKTILQKLFDARFVKIKALLIFWLTYILPVQC